MNWLFSFFLPYPVFQLVAFIVCVAFFLYVWRPSQSHFRRPFDRDARRSRLPMECDQKKRALILKQRFSKSAIPDSLDAVVVGSGIGSLTTAATLAKSGRKVLVLEQHDQAGGCMHSFIEQGYEWDVGVHYIGQMGQGEFDRFALDQITDGQLDWAKMDDDFDTTVLIKNNKAEMIPMWGDRRRLLDDLVARYPQHADSLRTFFEIMRKTSKTFMTAVIFKIMPLWMATFVTKLRLYNFFTSFFASFCETTLESLLEKLFGDDDEVKTVVSYCWGDYGVVPSKCGPGMLSLLYGHYARGGWYPVGGPAEVTRTIIPVIEKAGGRVLVNAKVQNIILEGRKAVGVRIETSSGLVDVRAPIVVSGAGVRNTFQRMLPKEIGSNTKIGRLLDQGRIKPSFGALQVFVGMKGSQEELKLPNKNFWVYNCLNVEKAIEKWDSLTMEEASDPSNEIPFLFIAFPSAKDPSYNDKFPGRSVCTIITGAPTHWFDQWKDEPVKHRGHDYESGKMQLSRRCWDIVCQLVPQVADAMDYIDAGTPLSNNYYLNSMAGETYGLDHGRERFAPDVLISLRPDVPEISNLYLTGQDVMTAGFVSSFYSGFVTSQNILKPLGECTNIFGDLKKLFLDAQKKDKETSHKINDGVETPKKDTDVGSKEHEE